MASTSSDRRHKTYEHCTQSSNSPLDVVNVKGISIAGWRIETQRGSIADSKTIEECSAQWDIPLPEMPFDKNKLILCHDPSGWNYQFDAIQALKSVEGVHEQAYLPGMRPAKTSKSVFGQKPAKSRRVKVAHANEWGKKREQQPVTASTGTSNFGSSVAVAAANGSIGSARDYDWTYSCTWPGAEVGESSKMSTGKDASRDRIPVERLGPPSSPGARPEPILFYDDLMLFEDELGDNGSSMLGVKVRVMPSGFLVLQRFFLRVDNVVFRIFDTRMYVGFDDDDEGDGQTSSLSSGTALQEASGALSSLSLDPTPPQRMRVIRECSGCQAKYSEVKARLPAYKPNDLSPLTDPGWVSVQLGKMQEEKQRGMASTHDITRPAVLPSSVAPGQETNRILGEVEEEEDRWEGEGQWVDVVILQGEKKL